MLFFFPNMTFHAVCYEAVCECKRSDKFQRSKCRSSKRLFTSPSFGSVYKENYIRKQPTHTHTHTHTSVSGRGKVDVVRGQPMKTQGGHYANEFTEVEIE